MKGLLKKIGFAGAVIMAGASMPALAAAAAGVSNNGLCALILAFVGAAFYIAKWAWGYISSGKFDLNDLKDKGTGMLVGFVLLFGIGVVLSFFLSSTGLGVIGCPELIMNW